MYKTVYIALCVYSFIEGTYCRKVSIIQSNYSASVEYEPNLFSVSVNVATYLTIVYCVYFNNLSTLFTVKAS